MAETFYDVLGVGAEASQDEIRAAYRERVKETHPDLNDAPDASDAFQRVQSAADVLGDPDERARYDRLGHASYTARFAGGFDEGDAGRWNVGMDRRAADVGTDRRAADVGRDDATASTGRESGRGARGGSTQGSRSGYGFDPDAYDRTRQRERDASGNPSQRSYDVGDDTGEPDDGTGEPDDGSTASSTAGAGATADAGARGATAGGTGRARDTGASDWRERTAATEQRWRKHAQRDGRGNTDTDGGYAVHDWNDDELDPTRSRYELAQSEAVLVGIMFLLYPFMAYSAVAPQFSLFVNVTVAACALLLTGYVLTMPRVGFYVFGSWSVIAPAFLFVTSGLQVVSILGLVVVGAAWIPFGYSVLFLSVLR